jgi:hypothetical protein
LQVIQSITRMGASDKAESSCDQCAAWVEHLEAGERSGIPLGASPAGGDPQARSLRPPPRPAPCAGWLGALHHYGVCCGWPASVARLSLTGRPKLLRWTAESRPPLWGRLAARLHLPPGRHRCAIPQGVVSVCSGMGPLFKFSLSRGRMRKRRGPGPTVSRAVCSHHLLLPPPPPRSSRRAEPAKAK